jgi:hypothetical protein
MEATQDQTEFYSPFAHIEGRYELCRIHSPSHGSFDTFIVVDTTTDRPVTVYVNSGNGEAFMNERYPESRCIRVPESNLVIQATPDNKIVHGLLKSTEGPVRNANLTFMVGEKSTPEELPYGGPDFQVWGSRWSCTGVDLNIPARVSADMELESGRYECLDGKEQYSGIITAGSSGSIRKLGG